MTNCVNAPTHPRFAIPRRLRVLVVCLLAVAACGTAVVAGFDILVDATPVLDTEVTASRLVLDRNGRLLRAFTVADGRWRLPVDLADLDPRYVQMLLAFEDRRFFGHVGVDPRALVRAGLQLATSGRILSGGSTISMQLVRLLDRASTRSLRGKFLQILKALALERRLSKKAILTAYLNLAPYGGNIEGVRAASLAWFGREPRRLTPAQAALLVSLPQSPEARRPDRDPVAARRGRDRVLLRALDAGVIDANEAAMARRERVPQSRRPFPLLAAHAARRALLAAPDTLVHRLTIEAQLQERLERLSAERAQVLGERVSVAILVADHRNGQILASVGSAGLFDSERDGFIDMTRAVRSPGSTLKPLIYGLAFESGIAHPESLIEDRPTGFAGYVPTNFDRGFHGTVTLRRALQQSLNVPAVKLLNRVGPARLVSRIRRAGAQPVLSDLSPPGLAIGLGGIGVRLTDLVAIYAAIARGGRALELRENLDAPLSSRRGKRVLGERAAWYLTSVLAGTPAPVGTSRGGVAFKTGTSYGYRDAWVIGFDGRHVIGVWVGRPDGAAVPGLTGMDAAAPILIDAFARLGEHQDLPHPPPGILTSSSADLPPPLRHFDARLDGNGSAPPGPRIAFPPDGARVEYGVGDQARLILKVRHGSPPFIWFADGDPVMRSAYSRTVGWRPRGPGFTSISVVDGRGRSSRVRVFIEPGSR